MGEPDSARLRLKRELYRSLAALEDSDDEPDPGRKASEAAFNKASITRQSTPAVREHRPLARSVSDIHIESLAGSAGRNVAGSTVPSSHADPRSSVLTRSTALLPRLKKTVSDTGQAEAPSKTTRKRKRETATAAKPGQLRIFKNLHFFFFPNNAVHPARRMRIDKAVERGAEWEQKWSNTVTHVIIDAAMDYATLLRYLRLEALPDNVAIVRETWPAECISFGAIVDPSQRRFAVERPQTPQLGTARNVDSHKSLQIEQSSKASMKRRLETPPQEPDLQVQKTAPVASAAVVNALVPSNIDSIADTFQAPECASGDFEEAIERAKMLQGIPLDEDDLNEEQDTPSFSGEPGRPNLELIFKRKRNKNKTPMENFQCMEKHAGDTTNSPNLQIIEILQKMTDYYAQAKDEWRVRAYRKAIATLRNHPQPIRTKEEALALPNVGERLASKIEEIASTDRLKRLESARAEPGDQVLHTFMKVYGAGVVQASRWADQGYRTIDELLQKADDLTENQRIGLEHFEDFNARIPRAEVERHGHIVRNALRQIDPAFQVIIGGSYRRGAKDSGDIDLMITRPDTKAYHLRNVVFGQLVPRLTADKFLVASLATSSRDDGSKWHGASCLGTGLPWRRIDLLLVPSDELGAALIYWTGNDIINRSLRLLASTKGMRLNQRGLYEGCLRGPGGTRLTEGTLVEGKDEKRIFEILGVPWRPPGHRNA